MKRVRRKKVRNASSMNGSVRSSRLQQSDNPDSLRRGDQGVLRLAALLLLAALLGGAAPDSAPSQQQPPADKSDQGAADRQQPGNVEQPVPETLPPDFVLVQPDSLQTEPTEDGTQGRQQNREFFDFNLTDLLMVLVTVGLGVIAWRQTIWMWRSAQIAGQEFVATHRPKVAVRFIETALEDGEDVVFVTVVNKGESNAEIVELGFGFGLWAESQWKGAEPDWRMKPVAQTPLASGQPHRLRLVAADGTYDSSFAFFEAKVQDSETKLAVIGEIRYRDGNNIIREVGFHRLYDATSKCWRPAKDSQYEYAD